MKAYHSLVPCLPPTPFGLLFCHLPHFSASRVSSPFCTISRLWPSAQFRVSNSCHLLLCAGSGGYHRANHILVSSSLPSSHSFQPSLFSLLPSFSFTASHVSSSLLHTSHTSPKHQQPLTFSLKCIKMPPRTYILPTKFRWLLSVRCCADRWGACASVHCICGLPAECSENRPKENGPTRMRSL